MFKKIEPQKQPVKVLISAPTGFGKTHTALAMAHEFMDGDMSGVFFIDTENGAVNDIAHKISGFNVAVIEGDITLEKITDVMREAIKAGAKCIILDSYTPFFSYINNRTEFGKAETAAGKLTYAQRNLIHEKFVGIVQRTPCDIIITARAQSETVPIEKQSKVRRVQPIINGKLEAHSELAYNVIVHLQISRKGYCYATKDRTGVFPDNKEVPITKDLFRSLKDFCNRIAFLPESVTPVVVESPNEPVDTAPEATDSVFPPIADAMPEPAPEPAPEPEPEPVWEEGFAGEIMKFLSLHPELPKVWIEGTKKRIQDRRGNKEELEVLYNNVVDAVKNYLKK